MTALTALRRAASATEFKFRDDLFDVIGSGAENAADTMGDRADDESEEFSDLAISGIGSELCERAFSTRYGSDPEAVRSWFVSQGVSF